MSGIEIQIQFEHIYARFSKETQITANGMLLHQGTDFLLIHASCNSLSLDKMLRGREINSLRDSARKSILL